MKRFWVKFEWDKWRNDPDLKRCSKETRGFWIDCIAEMEDQAERTQQPVYQLVGTLDQLQRIVAATAGETERSVNELERENAAWIIREGEIVKVVSRRLLRAANLTEYNRLKKRESRAKAAVNAASNDPSKKEIREERLEEEKDKESAAPIEQHPAVLLYEEKFQVKVSPAFANEIEETVGLDLGGWMVVLKDKIGYADATLEERKKISRWILKAYREFKTAGNQLVGGNNGTNRQNSNGNRKSSTERIEEYREVAANYPSEAELRDQR